MSARRVFFGVSSTLKRFYKLSLLVLLFIVTTFLFQNEKDEHQTLESFKVSHLTFKTVGIKNYPVVKNYERIDWHDYEFMKYEKERKGPGEQGSGVVLTDEADIDLDKYLERKEGLHVIVSDKISVNRSIKDTRPEICRSVQYFKELPSTSVIVILYNEWWSILLRTIHSIYNRTPRNLLKELIIVNDNSSKPELGEQLETYLKTNFDSRVKLLTLKQRKGLIVARMEGAKLAKGEVLVFLDSHMEMNVNWLPPLLEPLMISPTTVTTPTIDAIVWDTFEYRSTGGTRGEIDELFWFKWFGLRAEDTIRLDKPHQIPIMLGCAFAIRKDFFEDIGQYDEGLLIWNGEQIELSFKLHLCGGNLVEVPCSRMNHMFRSHQRNHQLDGVDVAARNFKRVAEIWLDDFKELMYQKDPKRRSIDAGDLTKARLVKERLNCKPFRYFLEEIAPEMYVRYYYQFDYPGFFAWGVIRSFAYPDTCLAHKNYNKQAELRICSKDKSNEPEWGQGFRLTYTKKIQHYHQEACLDIKNFSMGFCNVETKTDSQRWKYDMNTKQIINLSKNQTCLSVQNGKNKTLALIPCDKENINQKWTWGNLNETALKKIDDIDYDDKRKKFIGFE